MSQNITSFVEKFKAQQQQRQSVADKQTSRVEPPQIMINTTNSMMTSQQTVASVASSTVARIRTLDQNKSLNEKLSEKERSNSLNGYFLAKNAKKLVLQQH